MRLFESERTLLKPIASKDIKSFCLFAFLVIFPFSACMAAKLKVPSLKAHRTEKRPVIDGWLDEQCWAKADIATDFVEHKTIRLAQEQTLVRVVYDNQFLYIAFECLEPEPDKILTTTRKDDRHIRGEDWVQVQFDTFHDRRCSYLFKTNTYGVRYDARIGFFSKLSNLDTSWDCDWEVVCRIAEDRWYAEMAIPIGQMHHIHKDNTMWGINFHRSEKGLQEMSSWSYPGDSPYNALEFGTLTHVNLSSSEIPLEPKFETYISSTANLYDAGTGKINGGTNEFSSGLDMSLRFNSQWISTFTYNPDFGQVEADPDTIELRDTERFLKEERTFFKEGAELFYTPIKVYYSRRFVDVDAGAKITGQGKNWAIGLLDIKGAVNRDEEEISGNYHVGRLIGNLGGDSQFGAIWLNSNRKNGSNFTGGLDSKIFFDSDTYFTGQILHMKDNRGIDTDGNIDHSGHGMYFALDGGRKPWRWAVDYRNISRGFRPDLGYIPRRNIKGPGSFFGYDKDLEDGPIKSYHIFSWIDYYQDNENDTSLRDYVERVGVEFRNEWEFRFYRADKFHAPFQNHYNRIWTAYNRVDWWNSIEGGYEWGVYEDVPYHEYELEKPIKLSDRLTTNIEGSYRVERPETGDESIWLWRWVSEYTFNWDGRLKFTTEETSEKRYNITLLFSWPIDKQTDFYLLANDFRAEETEMPERGVFTKLVYRF